MVLVTSLRISGAFGRSRVHRAAALLLLGAAPADAEVVPSPAAIAASIARQGAAATLAEIDKAQQLDAVLARIGGGQAAWIALVPKLDPAADAAAAEGFGIAPWPRPRPARRAPSCRLLIPPTGR